LKAEEGIASEAPNNDVKDETDEGADTDRSEPEVNQRPDEKTKD
jgi:hypothetical protein